jgi:hypothetical protein
MIVRLLNVLAIIFLATLAACAPGGQNIQLELTAPYAA